ncbi:hypothetical protein C9E91_08545 [Rhizobium sp. SEMIA4064]|nr:hypothetical protein C9E91_08545 [Rhizobium sp. SEMIA4064]
MESLPSVRDYCKNGLFPSQGGIGKKFCSSLFVRAAKFDLATSLAAIFDPVRVSPIGDIVFHIGPLIRPKAATMMRYL